MMIWAKPLSQSMALTASLLSVANSGGSSFCIIVLTLFFFIIILAGNLVIQSKRVNLIALSSLV
jgi:hypothetical protein